MLKRLNFALYLCLLLLSGCAQWWQVRPYSSFVSAEIKPGDEIRVETVDGNEDRFTVVAVHVDRLVTANQTILLDDILRLEKLSKTPPANPCSPQVPLGCSVPEWATWLHTSQARYQEFFYPSCEQHDYCYRHGMVTYGLNQASCDTEFLQNMKNQCHPDDLKKLLLGPVDDIATCNAVAVEFYVVVQKYGASRFSTSTSTYCEYKGPP